MTDLVYTPAHAGLIVDESPRTRTDRWGMRLTLLTCVVWLCGLFVGFETSLSVLAAIAFAITIIGVFRPSLGMLGVAMLCTLDVIIRHFLMTGGILRWNTFNYVLLGVTLLGVPLLVMRRDLQTRLAIVFAILLVVQLQMASQWRTGAQHILNFVAVFGLLVYFVRAHRDRDAWYWQGVICGVTAAGGGLVYYLQADSLYDMNSNAWDHFPVCAIFAACLAGAVTENSSRRLPLLLLTSINFGWVFLSGSRGGMLIAAVGLLFLLAQNRRLSRSVMGAVLVGALVLGVSAVFSGQQANSVGRIQRLFDTNRTMHDRTSGRSDLARDALVIFRQHPFGVGTGDFGVVRAGLSSRSIRKTFAKGHAIQAHSGWCQTLAENGIAGILLHIAIVGSFAYVGWRSERHVFHLGLFVTVALSFAFISTEFQGKSLWFLTAATTVLLTDARALLDREIPEQPDSDFMQHPWEPA